MKHSTLSMEYLKKRGQRILDSCTPREMGCGRDPQLPATLWYIVIILPIILCFLRDVVHVQTRLSCGIVCVVLFSKLKIRLLALSLVLGQREKNSFIILEFSSDTFWVVVYYFFFPCSLANDFNNFSALIGRHFLRLFYPPILFIFSFIFACCWAHK